jgi:hypothetical protein
MYPEGFFAQSKNNGVVIGGDFTINVKAELSKNKKTGQFPVDIDTVIKTNLKEDQFKKVWVDGKRGYLYMSDTLAIQFLPLTEVVVVAMCSPSQETINFEKKAQNVLGSLIVHEPKKMLEGLKVDLSLRTEATEPKQTFIKPRKTVIDKKNLSFSEYFENDDLFVRLPYNYIAKDMGSEVVIKTIISQNKQMKIQTIAIALLEQSTLSLENWAVQTMGRKNFKTVKAGNQDYLAFDLEDTLNEKTTMLYGRTYKNDLKIIVNGSLGLNGTNMDLLKSIVYK